MPEQELPPTEIADSEALKRFELVRPIADAQAVDIPDNRALEGEDILLVSGDNWEKWASKQLFRARIFLLVCLFILVVMWLISIPGLLLLIGYGWRGFLVSDTVVVVYMTTTTVSVIGLFKIAATWLFSDVSGKTKSR